MIGFLLCFLIVSIAPLRALALLIGVLLLALRWIYLQIQKVRGAQFSLWPRGQNVISTTANTLVTNTSQPGYLPFPIVSLVERFGMKKCLHCDLAYDPRHETCPSCSSRETGRTATAEEAVQFLDNLLALKKARDHVTEGTRYFQAGDPLAARAEFRKAIELLPTYAIAHSNLGVVLCQTGYVTEGLQHLQIAMDLDPELRDKEGVGDVFERLQREHPHIEKKPNGGGVH